MAIPHPLVFMCGLMIGLQLQPKILPGSIQTRIEPSSMLEMQQNGDLAKKGTRILTTTISKVNTVSPNIFFFIWIFQKSFEKARLEPHFSNSILHQNLRVETNHKNQIFSNLSGSRELPLQSEEWIGKVNDYSYDPIQPANSYDYDSYDSYDYDSYHYEGPAEEPVQVKCTSIAGKKIELCIVKAH